VNYKRDKTSRMQVILVWCVLSQDTVKVMSSRTTDFTMLTYMSDDPLRSLIVYDTIGTYSKSN